MPEPERLDARPTPVARPVFHNVWDELAFLHWPVEAAEVDRLLPDGLRADVHDDSAWVSLVPFVMRGVRPTGLPPVPWLSTFAETNVRTYVVDADGRRGVWFASLEAQRLPIVAIARWLMRFPYVWSAMSVTVDGDRRIYETHRRRWPRSTATSRVVLDVGAPIGPADGGLHRFLTARWFAHTSDRRGVRRAPVEHPPWQLRQATLVEGDDALVRAGGFRPLTGEPIVAFAERVDAHFGRVERPTTGSA